MIDALDEEVEILFQILQDDVPLLPPTVRLFVTSRDTGYLRSLKQDSHFYLLNLDIREESNLNNIQTFAHHALKDRENGRVGFVSNLARAFEYAGDAAQLKAMVRSPGDNIDKLFNLITTSCIVILKYVRYSFAGKPRDDVFPFAS